MTEAPLEPEKSERRKGLSGCSKGLIGCGIGCAGLLAILFGLFAWGLWWIFSAGNQVETKRIAGEDTVFAAHVADVLDDQGFVELLDMGFSVMQEAAREQRRGEMPEALQWLEDLNAATQPSGSESVEIYTPYEATLVVEPRADGEGGALVVAVNFRNFVRPARFFLEQFASDEPRVREHDVHGYSFFELDPEDWVVGFVGGTLVMGEEVDAVRRAVGRLERADGTPRPDIVRRLDEAEEWSVLSATGGPGDLRAVIETLTQEDLADPDVFGEWGAHVPRRFETLHVGVQPRSADRVEAWLEIRCERPEELARALREGLQDAELEWELDPAVLTSEVTVDGDLVRADVSIEGLERALREWFDRNR